MTSTGSGTTVFGLYVENDGDSAVTINAIKAGTVHDLDSVRYWALPPRNFKDTSVGVGVESFREVKDWSDRRPVAGAPLPAHSSVAIVILPRLTHAADSGYVRDFTIRLTGASGIQHVFHSQSTVGFYPATTKSGFECIN
jgi:hypothetical protein